MACNHLSSIPLAARRSIIRTRGFVSSSYPDFAFIEVLIPRNLGADTLVNIVELLQMVKSEGVLEIVSATLAGQNLEVCPDP